MADNKPAHTIQAGQVRCAIWAHQDSRTGTWFSTSFSRVQYTEGEPKNFTSFNRNDLPIVAKLADLAFRWIWEQDAATTTNTSSN